MKNSSDKPVPVSFKCKSERCGRVMTFGVVPENNQAVVLER